MVSCKGAKVTPPEDPTNEDAIYNIIRYDRQLEFNLDLLDSSTPDTNMLMLAPPYRPRHYWRNIERDSLFIDIDINYPDANDSIGSVPWAEVALYKVFWGAFEVIAEDTAGGESERIRMSKPFTMLGRMDAIFEKVGFDYNTRRGWILTRISDAIYVPLGMAATGPMSLAGVDIRREDGSVVTTNSGLKLLRNVPTFSPGESLIVIIRVNQTDDLVSIRYAAGEDYIARQPSRVDSLTYSQGFRLPAYEEYNHFGIDVVGGEAVTDTFPYHPNGRGVLYRVR